jgi:hypothetical protein
LLIGLPAVEPQVQDFITHQTTCFVQDLIENINKTMPPGDRIDFAYVDSM